MYYAYFCRGGKQIKKSLKTKDRAYAKRKLKDLLEQHGRLNLELGRQTIRQLKERYMATTGNLSASSVTRLNGIVRHLEKSWPGGLDTKVQDVLPSDVRAWTGEVAALTKASIDWKKIKISVNRLKAGRSFIVPIFPQLEPLLRRLYENAGEDPNAALFQISSAKKALIGSCSRLKLPNYTHRAFRRML
jgi:integrase